MSDIIKSQQTEAQVDRISIAGFWRRVTAFAIDGLILGLPAFAIGFVFYDWACALGQAGRLIGFFVMLCYFTYFDSSLGGGQALGKRLLGIKIVLRTGQSLSPIIAALRFLVIGVPYFLNGVWIDDTRLPVWQQHMIAIPVTFIVFGCGGAIIYLFVFNRRTRQSLHDLAIGSFVVRLSEPRFPIILSMPRRHLVIMTCFLFLGLALPIASSIKPRNGAFEQSQKLFLALQGSVEANIGVRIIGLSETNTSFWSNESGASTQSYLVVRVDANRYRGSLESLALKVADFIMDQTPDILGKRSLTIVVQHGFDLGIASWRDSFSETFDGDTLRSKVNKTHSSTMTF